MSSVRYSSSFVISSIVYIVIVAIYFNIMDRPKPMHKPKEHRIKIAIITPPILPKIKPKPIVKSTPIPTPIIVPPKPKIRKVKHKKIKHKKLIKKKIIKKYKKRKVIKQYKQKPKPKHKIKKVIKHKKVIREPKIIHQPTQIVQKREVIKPYVETYIEPIIEATPIPIQKKIITRPRPIKREVTPIPIQTEVISRPKPIKKVISQRPKENLSATKREFLKGVRAKIYANKRYPARARRRHIQGRVHVVFDILSDGEATNIRIGESSRILKKEVRRSMRKSFPIDIPPSLASMFPMRNISVNIDFELE